MMPAKCLDCGRFHREDRSFCAACRQKHLTTGTPDWKIPREAA